MKADIKQIKRIYGLARELNISDGTKTDELHALVSRETKKDSIALLTYSDAERVVKALNKILNSEYDRREKDHRSKLIWALMYELQSFDKEKNTAPLSKRLAGIINRHLKLDVADNRPLYKLTDSHKIKVISIIKGYIKTAGGGAHDD